MIFSRQNGLRVNQSCYHHYQPSSPEVKNWLTWIVSLQMQQRNSLQNRTWHGWEKPDWHGWEKPLPTLPNNVQYSSHQIFLCTKYVHLTNRKPSDNIWISITYSWGDKVTWLKAAIEILCSPPPFMSWEGWSVPWAVSACTAVDILYRGNP